MRRLLHTGLNAGGESPQVVGGRGAYFFLNDGRSVLDGSNTGGPLGHGHPKMAEALRAAADLPMVSEGWNWQGRDKAADDLFEIGLVGEEWAGAVRFCLSGSEANDVALSLSQALTGRHAIATRERAYHGLVGLSRDVTVQPHWHGGLAAPNGGTKVPPPCAPVHVLPAPDGALYLAGGPHRIPLEQRLAEAPAQLAQSAAVILDYTQGGFYHDGAYQDAVAAIARREGALWIADEVVTGMGRAGRAFAFQGGASRPDIVTLGKGLGGGMVAVAAIVLSKDVVAELDGKSWQNYGTLRGHPLAMAAVSAYLRIVRDEGLLGRVHELERRYADRLLAIARRHPSVARVAGQGLHWTVELHGPDWRNWLADTPEAPIASKVSAKALSLGAVIGTSGEQTSLFLAPPLIISDEESDRLLAILDESLELADREHNTLLDKAS